MRCRYCWLAAIIEIVQNASLVDVLEISRRFLAQNKEAYEVLAE